MISQVAPEVGPATAQPYLDDSGLLRVGPRWVAIPDTQLALVRLLLDRYARVVHTSEVLEAYERAGGSGHIRAVQMMLSRLRKRTSTVGLEVVTIRNRGILLRRC